MQIIITVASYYPLKDGVQTVTQYHAEGLASKGHEVTVVTGLVENSPNLEEYNGVKIIRINVYNKNTLHFGNKKEYRKLILNLTKEADILIAVCLQSVVADWLLAIMDDIACHKFLYMHGMHDFKWRKHDFYSISAFAKKIIRDVRWKIFYTMSFKNIRKFDMISHLHECDTAYEYFEKHKLGKNTVLENAADEVFFLVSLYRIIELPEKYMISVANYDIRKNQAMCLEAFYKAKTQDYGLVFIGSKRNKYYEYLLSYKKKLEGIYGEKDVYMFTDIPRIEVCRYVKNAICYLMSSTWEAFPISIIEAMACSVPVISSNVGIIRLLPGTIIIMNVNDMKKWIECLINEPQVAEYIGKSGRTHAEKYLRQSVQIDKLERLILNILNYSFE